MVAQGLLAGAIAGALGSFCDINEAMVESKLLDKKKITLTNVRLKPRVIRRSENYTLELHGKIKQGVFKWKWTGKGLLKGCSFTMAGLRVTIKPGTPGSGLDQNKKQQGPTTRKKSKKKKKKSDNGSTEENKEGRKGWKAKIINNIIDQLKVTVEDFELVVEAPRNSEEEDIPWKRQIRITGKNIELESLGRIYPKSLFRNSRINKKNYDSAPLLQDLSIGSVSADVIVVDTTGNAQAFPLLHPFQYLARAKRFFGKRFSGFTSGLEVQGLEMLPSEQILLPSLHYSGSFGEYESIVMGSGNVGVYVDEQEIETSLCNEQLLNMSHSVSWEFGTSSGLLESRDEMEVQNDDRMEASSEIYIVLGNEQLTAFFGILSMFTDKSKPAPSQNDVKDEYSSQYVGPGGLKQLTKIAPMNFGRKTRSINKASKYDLPIPSVQLILPNGTSVRAGKCKFELRTDDSLAKLFGSGCVFVNDEEFLNEGSGWSVDLKSREITVDPKGISQVAQWDWGFNNDEDEAHKPIEVSFDHIRCIGAGVAKVLEKRRALQRRVPSRKSNSGWSIKVNGKSQLTF